MFYEFAFSTTYESVAWFQNMLQGFVRFFLPLFLSLLLSLVCALDRVVWGPQASQFELWSTLGG